MIVFHKIWLSSWPCWPLQVICEFWLLPIKVHVWQVWHTKQEMLTPRAHDLTFYWGFTLLHGLDFFNWFCLCPMDFMLFGNLISEFVLFWIILRASITINMRSMNGSYLTSHDNIIFTFDLSGLFNLDLGNWYMNDLYLLHCNILCIHYSIFWLVYSNKMHIMCIVM